MSLSLVRMPRRPVQRDGWREGHPRHQNERLSRRILAVAVGALALASCSSGPPRPNTARATTTARETTSTPFPIESPSPDLTEVPGQPGGCGQIPFPGAILYGEYETTGCWQLVHHSTIFDLSGGSAPLDRTQGIIFVFVPVSPGEPLQPHILLTARREGPTTIYAATDDHICFTERDRPTIPHLVKIEELTFDDAAANGVCPRPPNGPPPTPAFPR